MGCSCENKREFLRGIYKISSSILGKRVWERVISTPESDANFAVPDMVEDLVPSMDLPAFLPDLMRVEHAVYQMKEKDVQALSKADGIRINPSLEVLRLSWKVVDLYESVGKGLSGVIPEKGEEFVLVWIDPVSLDVKIKAATADELFAIKIVVDDICPECAAESTSVPVGRVDAAIDGAVNKGLLLRPGSRIRRTFDLSGIQREVDEDLISAETFSIQWHITQACDLSCKHCYDRSERTPMDLDVAIGVLDDLRSFCQQRFVNGHVCFTGGNPFLYPHFRALYQEASDRNFLISILGNPVPRKWVEELLEIQAPTFYQVSLEGLREHNDMIRGEGHFDRIFMFLDLLKELGVTSSVMLTLTRDNVDQVLPLAGSLREKTDNFTFNRLSQVGEGANLLLPSKERFSRFLEEFADASGNNPAIYFKDNLTNIVLEKKGVDLFDGCTGYGCGAAFNFIAVLSDGEVHACRKFPSPIGNVFTQQIEDVYDSEAAIRYRQGSSSCSGCSLRPACGGCLAIAYSHGLDIFKEKDPYCFREL